MLVQLWIFIGLLLNHVYNLIELGRRWIIAVYATLYILGKIWARLSIVCLTEAREGWNSALLRFTLLKSRRGQMESWYVGKKDVREKFTRAAKTEFAFCRVHTGRSDREIWVCARGRDTALNYCSNKCGVFALRLEVDGTYAFSFCRLGVAATWSHPLPPSKLRNPDYYSVNKDVLRNVTWFFGKGRWAGREAG